MRYKCILNIFITSILIIAILNSSYADTSVLIGENQARYIAQDYLSSHSLLYNTTTVTWMMQIKNKKTGHIKWISMSQCIDMTGDNITRLYEDPNFEWKRFNENEGAWKVDIVNRQGKEVGNIWINSYNGKIIKINLPTINQNNTDSNKTINATNTTNQTSPEQNNQSGPLSSNIGIILATAVIAIVLGFGYWKFNGK